MVNGSALLVPLDVVTVTAAAPDAFAAIVNVAVIWLGSGTFTLLTVTPALFILTTASEEKFVPEMSIFTLVPAKPLAGLSKVRVGGALDCAEQMGTAKAQAIRHKYRGRREMSVRAAKTTEDLKLKRGAFDEHGTPCNDREPPTGLPGHYSGCVAER